MILALKKPPEGGNYFVYQLFNKPKPPLFIKW
jgi:hypothetical protein